MEKLLIWDIDGTLIQCKGMGKRIFNKVFLKLYNIKNAFDKIPMEGMVDAVILSLAYENNNIKERNFGEFFTEYCFHLSEALVEDKKSFANPGIIKLMEFIKNNSSAYNVLGTGNIELGARIKLSRDNLNRYFKIGSFGDEPFERWQLINNSIEKSKKYFNKKFENSNIFVIGDTPRDIEAAKKINVKSLAVATGSYTLNELNEYNPDYLVNDFSNFKVIKEILYN
jgi:phosphoglycolate phosphatase-like HAD superfamily hydrolase